MTTRNLTKEQQDELRATLSETERRLAEAEDLIKYQRLNEEKLEAKLAEAVKQLSEFEESHKRQAHSLINLSQYMNEQAKKLAEAEAINEANYAEYTALREVERAARRESSLHGNGCASETGSLKCDCGRGETIAALAAVDALRREK